MGERLKVRLAEVPTDVLVHLAAHPTQQFTIAELAEALAPEGASGAEGSVASALSLLKAGKYVFVREGAWGITTAGVAAVDAAVRV